MNEKKKQEIKEALAEIRVEAKQLMNNIMILEEELEKVQSLEEVKRYDTIAAELINCFKHIEIF